MLVLSVEKTDSTQLFLKRIIGSQQQKQIIACIAREQTNGYGRRGDRWVSGAGGLYFSVYVPDVKIEGLSIRVACAVAKAIEEILQDRVLLKWPNDIFFLEKKLAGIIIEIVDKDAIIGVGVNVNNNVSDVGQPAVSLAELGIEITPDRLFYSILKAIVDLPNTNKAVDFYNSRLFGKGCLVEITGHNGELIKGRIEGITSPGALLVGGRQVLSGRIVGWHDTSNTL